MEKQMGVSAEQMAALEGTLASFPDVSDTQNGIMVSTAQCLFDGNDIRMAFYVDGYSMEEGEEPALESLDIFIDGEQVNNYEWFFYNGIDWNENREPMMEWTLGEEEGAVKAQPEAATDMWMRKEMYL